MVGAVLVLALSQAVTQTPAAAPAASPPPSVAVALQPAIGLSDTEATDVHDKLVAELGALGVTMLPAAAVDPACVPDAACVAAVRAALADAPPALLVVELVRVGPVVQLTATGATGSTQVTGSHGLDEAQLKQGPLLPDNVAAWAKALVPPPVVIAKPPPKAPLLTPMKTAALGTAGGGAALVVAGAVLVGLFEPVLEDKTSAGADKESAITFEWVGAAGAALGVVAIATGAALYFVDGAGPAPTRATTP